MGEAGRRVSKERSGGIAWCIDEELPVHLGSNCHMFVFTPVYTGDSMADAILLG